MFEFITIARILFSLLFSLIFLYVFQFITEVGKKKCPLASSLYISNGKLFGGILIMIGLINIILPINKFIYNIPVIGTSYVFIIMLLIFVMFFVLKRIISNLQEDENKKCRTKSDGGDSYVSCPRTSFLTQFCAATASPRHAHQQ